MSDRSAASSDDSAYWARKHDELALLTRFAGADDGGPTPITVTEFLHETQSLRRRLLTHLAEAAADVPETSPHGRQTIATESGEVSYSYQRYDLRATGRDWLREVHLRDVPGRAADGLYTSSGMGAIAPLLAVIARAGMRTIAVSPDAYFELAWITERFFPGLTLTVGDVTLSPDADVLWLDTISSTWPDLPTERGSAQLIVVDTTCVEPTSDHVLSWLEAGERLGLPLVLVRSHLKLDCFGLELARLGSAVVVAPASDPTSIATLVQHLREAVSLFGTTFTIPSLYPWLGDPEFARLTRARTEGLRASTARLAEALAANSAGYEVLPRAHGLALLLRLDRHGESVDAPLGTAATPPSSLARRIADACAERGLPVVAAGSFGLDQIAVTDFTDLRDGRHYIRLCGADVPGVPETMVAEVVHAVVASHEAGG